MSFFKNAKNTVVLILLIPILLLFVSAIIDLSSNKSDLIELNATHNPYLLQLPERYITQISNSTLKDTAYVYSVDFYESDFERQLVLIKKNSSKGEFLTTIQIHVYPKNPEHFKNSPNYNDKGFLDYTTTTNPVMHKNGTDNFSLREVVLPFIDIEKIYAYQPGIWKKTFELPFNRMAAIKGMDYVVSKDELYKPLFYYALNKYNISYLPYKDDEQKIIESPNNYIKDHDQTLGEIKNTNKFWSLLQSKDPHYRTYVNFKGNHKTEADSLFSNLIQDKIAFSQVFNIEKLASYYALLNLFSVNQTKNIGLLYNKATNQIEPFYHNTNKLGALNTYVKDEKINDILFLKSYIQKLNEVSHLNIRELIKNTLNFSSRIKSFNSIDPSVLFEVDILKYNQLVLKKGANPSTSIKAEFISLENKVLTISVKNLSDFPLDVVALNYRKKKTITNPKNKGLILSGKRDTISFYLPRSFENLFVHKKTKTTGFIFEKNIVDLMLSYKINGLNYINYTEIIPYQPTKNYIKSQDLFRKKINLIDTSYLTINETEKTILIHHNFTLKSPLIFPKGYTVKVTPGITINIEDGGKIISYSPLEFIGDKNNPIRIISKDRRGQGLLVLSNGKESKLQHVEFDGLTNPSHGMWSTTSAITFYESPVNLDYVRITNNSCEDALNIVRTHFRMTNTLFSNTQSDAFDGDFAIGMINSCVFENLGNDAIDVSGSDLNISNIKIINAGDKALSAGENSKLTITQAIITGCEIAIAGKDLSIVTVKNLTITNTKLGFTAFQKKPEFGPSTITANTVEMIGVETKYLIENTSQLTIDNEIIKTEQADVKSRMYGVEFGVSSDETRNSKKN